MCRMLYFLPGSHVLGILASNENTKASHNSSIHYLPSFSFEGFQLAITNRH